MEMTAIVFFLLVIHPLSLCGQPPTSGTSNHKTKVRNRVDYSTSTKKMQDLYKGIFKKSGEYGIFLRQNAIRACKQPQIMLEYMQIPRIKER